MITYIHRSRLEPHPDNPRKNLGDLDELAASIRKQGLLQNLTVVPSPEGTGKYRIVIGHRRFNASALAGLDELPCVIDEKMTYPEQIAVMMSENIQRNDLTIAEKAGGVQMMMDLGMDVGEISGNTGISNTSIRRYAKIGKLNKADVASAEKRGATLMQFAEISEIEDEDLREAALRAAGTGEYNNVMYRVRNRKLKDERLPLIIRKLNEFAAEIYKEDYGKYTWSENVRFADAEWRKVIDGMKRKKDMKYAYRVREYDVVIYEERQIYDEAETAAVEEKQERLRARINHEKEIAARFKELRSGFMEGLEVKGREAEALCFALWVSTRTEYQSAPRINGLFDRAYTAKREEKPASYSSAVQVTADEILQLIPEKKLLHALVMAAYDRITDGDMSMLDRYSGKKKERDEILQDLYWHLTELGYQMSEEEEAWLDGTHECYSYPHNEQAAAEA